MNNSSLATTVRRYCALELRVRAKCEAEREPAATLAIQTRDSLIRVEPVRPYIVCAFTNPLTSGVQFRSNPETESLCDFLLALPISPA